MDASQVAALVARLADASEAERVELFASLRRETSLDWGTDVTAWQEWWRYHETHELGRGSARLTSKAEEIHAALVAMGVPIERDEVEHGPHLRRLVAGCRRGGLSLPDDPAYYTSETFVRSLRDFLAELATDTWVSIGDPGFQLVLDGMRVQVPDRPRIRLFAALGAYLADAAPTTQLWIDAHDRAWRLTAAQAAAWARHGIPLGQVPRPEGPRPPPLRQPIVAAPELARLAPGAPFAVFDVAAHTDISTHVLVADELLATAGVVARCAVADADDETIAIQHGAQRFVSPSTLDAWRDFELASVLACVNAVLAAEAIPRRWVQLREPTWDDELAIIVGAALVDPAQRAALDAEGLLATEKGSDPFAAT